MDRRQREIPHGGHDQEFCLYPKAKKESTEVFKQRKDTMRFFLFNSGLVALQFCLVSVLS